MDSEGSEYEALLATPGSLLVRFRIMVVEFHYLDYLFSAPVFAIYSQVFEKILSTHTCVHIHPNNICSPITVLGNGDALDGGVYLLEKRSDCESRV